MATSQEIKLIIKAVAEGKGFDDIKKGLDDVKKKTDETSKSTNQLKSFFGGLLPALGAAALISGFKSITDAAMDSERVNNRLVSTIKNLGLETKVSTKDVLDFADSLSRLAGIEDEEVISSFERFIKLTKDEKSAIELSKLAAQIAVKEKISMAEATDLLYKALQGQTKGLQQVIPGLKDMNSSEEMLLKTNELTKGSIEDFGNTTEGAMSQAKQSFKSLQESSGALFTPMLGCIAKVADWLIRHLHFNLEKTILKFKQAGNGVKALADMAGGNFKAWGDAMKKNEQLEIDFANKASSLLKTKEKEEENAVVKTSAFKGMQFAKDKDAQKKAAEEAEKLAKEEEQKRKDRSRRVKEEWDNKAKLAGKDVDKQRKILEDSTKDARLIHEDKVKQQQQIDEIDLKNRQEFGDQAMNITSAIASGDLNSLKSIAIAKIQTWGAEAVSDAMIKAPLSWGATLAAIAPILAAVAAGTAAVNAVKLAEGGIVTKPTSAIIGEAGPEAVIPLNKAGALAPTIHIHAGAMMGKNEDAYQFAKVVQKQVTRINRRNITV